MMTRPVPPLISLSERVYRALLILYPAGYRREYGALMAQVFRDMCRDTYRARGALGIALWWCTTLLDLTLTAIEQRRKVRLVMPRSLIIQLTGIALILGGVCGAFSAFSQLQPGSHYNYYGIYQVAILFFIPTYLLIGLGGMGMVLRYGATAGQIGRLALLGNGIGGLIIAFGFAFTQFDERLWTVGMIGLIIHATSAVVFGLTNLRPKNLPIPGWLPLLSGVMLLLLISGVLRTNFGDDSDPVGFAYVLLYSALWVIMGISIHRDVTRVVPAAA